MANAELNVVLSADGKQLADVLQRAEKDVNDLGGELKKLKPALDGVDKSLSKTAGDFKKTAQASQVFGKSILGADKALAKLPAHSNAATQSLINLGRVAQDAPFGFLGIANNLNPLLESFQRLKAESGSSKTALKSLAGSLMGAGGLGFALSIASSLLILFGDKLFGIGKKSQEANARIKETAERIKELLRPLSEFREQAVAGTAEELSKVTALSNAVLDQTKSYSARNNALNQLKKINESYFGDLTLETAKLGLLRDRVDEYTKAIISAAIVKAFSDEIGKLAVELANQDRAFNEAGKNLQKYQKELANTKESETSLTGEDRVTQAFVKAKKAVKSATSDFSKQATVVGQLRDQMFNLRTEIQAAVDASLDFRPLEIIKAGTTKTPKVKEIKENLQPRILIENLVLVKSQAYFASLRTESEKLLKDLQEEIQRLTKKNPIIIEANRVQAEQKARGAELTTALGLSIPGVNAQISLLTTLQKQAVNAANTINGVLSTAFDNLFAAIKAGENPIRGFFEGIMQAVGELIQRLVKAIATAFILNAIFPGLGGQEGAFGIFKSLLGFKAQGGPVFAGKPYVVGEQGPELFIPGRSGKIVPNQQMSGLAGVTGGPLHITVDGRIRGRELRLVNARQQGFENRNI